MELRDLIVTPVILILVFWGGYIVRPWVTDDVTRKYFFPALWVRVFGALAVGFIYQFYYEGGDTFNFHTRGSRIVWEAFTDSPQKGFQLLFNSGNYTGVYEYASQIPFFRDPQSYAIIQIAAFFDLFTFSSYAATAILFAVLSFSGMWMFFLTFYQQYPHLHRWLAIASFFIPSVFFWGSGLLKDTITLSFLGMATYFVYRIFILKKITWIYIILLPISIYFLFSIKIYILLCFLPAAIMWIFLLNFSRIRSTALRFIFAPFMVLVAGFLAYFATVKATEDNPKYALGNIAKTAQITAYDIRYWTGREAGSGYSLGDLDGTFTSMLNLAPAAVNVSLFRPYLWEVNNPLMLLSALESTVMLLFTLYVLFKKNLLIGRALLNPTIFFLLIFSIVFAFAVGVSTYNFGSLVRYKIPLLPFYLTALFLILDYSKSDRKFSALEPTE